MSFKVGDGYFSAYIDSDRLYDICMQETRPVMSLWEKIKDFFFGNKQREALDYLYKLCHPSIHFTSDEAEDIFFKLKELASPGYQKRFCHAHIEHSYSSKLHIKDNRGNDLLCIEQYGQLCNYTILGKRFIFHNEATPYSPFEFSSGKPPLRIASYHEAPPLREGETWMRNNVLSISSKENVISIDVKGFYDDFLRELKSYYKGYDFDEWKQQEKTTYFSAVVNKRIDEKVAELQIGLSKSEKEALFDIVQKKTAIRYLELDVVCAQSSIKNTVLTMVYRMPDICALINKALSSQAEKNEIIATITHALSNNIVEGIFKEDGSLDCLEKQVSNIHAIVDKWLSEKKNNQHTHAVL